LHRILDGDPAVVRVARVLTMQLGPHEVLLNVEVVFRRGIATDDLVTAVSRMEAAVKEEHPEVRRIFVEAHGFAGGEPARDAAPGRAPSRPGLVAAPVRRPGGGG